MPSQSVLEQKKAIVAELSERLKNSITGLVVEYKGINTEDDTKLRKELRDSDSEYAAAARILCKYAKDHENFKVKSGYLDGAVIDMDTITALSKLPTREVLLANVLGAFQAPIAAFARVIQAVVDEGGFDACLAKKEAEAAPAEEAAEAPAAE